MVLSSAHPSEFVLAVVARTLLMLLVHKNNIAGALDNGLALTPPMGWRSWNFFQGDIDDTRIRGQIDAMLVKRPVVGKPKPLSLLDLGYRHAGVDDGWQQCASYFVMPSNTSSFHGADGQPIVNETKFPDLKALSQYAQQRGILLGWYENNCICHESGGHIGHSNDTWVNLSYIGDVQQLVENDFKGVKIDNCGLHNDMERYAALMNATGKAFLTERSDQGHGTPINDPKGNRTAGWCPYNLFRSSGDIRASWGSVHNNLHSVTKYSNISRPGCWAYPDMLQCGNLEGPLAAAESRSHFGAWCIVSSPLILGMDLTNATTMAAVWPYVSNTEAIAVNQAWLGDPGQLIFPPDIGGLATSRVPQIEVWAKAQPSGAFALLAINTGASVDAKLELNLAEALHLPGWCSGEGSCAVRDIWAQKNSGTIVGGAWSIKNLPPHDSLFVLITPVKVT